MSNLNPIELHKKGIDALTTALGPIGMIRFLQQFDLGIGNYTEDRKKWLEDQNIDDIVKQIKEQK